MVQAFIDQYGLLPHPEGGYYKETYRSQATIPAGNIDGFQAARSCSTAIYFLLEQGNFSAFHKIKSDECWHFYAGQALLVYVINAVGDLEIIKLGANSSAGEVFQYVVPANCWFASEPAIDTAFSFVGCTVSPGFDFADFELATIAELSAKYPKHQATISRLCRM